MSWHNLIGGIGVLLILGTYLALQLGRIRSYQPMYSVLNGLGAAGILVSLFVDFNLPAFIVEAAWLVISGIGLYRDWDNWGAAPDD